VVNDHAVPGVGQGERDRFWGFVREAGVGAQPAEDLDGGYAHAQFLRVQVIHSDREVCA
jgi:hypothetical protein